MARTLRLEIVTPEAKAYSEDVEMVVLAGSGGRARRLSEARPVADNVEARRAARFQRRAGKLRSRSAKDLSRSRANPFRS